MSRRNALLLALAATLVLSVLPNLIDPYEESIDLGPGSEALRNPFFAAERFLAASGVHASNLGGSQKLRKLDEGIGTLILGESRLVLSEPQLERLLAWVDAGGNLIVGAPPPARADPHDLLSAHFGFSTHRVNPPEKPASDAKPNEELTQVLFAGEEVPLRAHFTRRRFLHHPALDEQQAAGEDAPPVEGPREPVAGEVRLVSVAGNRHGPQMLRFESGRGRVTVLVDTGIWDFGRIERYEHAWLLYRLVEPERNGREVRVLYDRAMPSLASLLRRHASQPLLAGALLLGAWLWHRGRRFGAAREPLSEGRRALAEHLQASAAYLWRNGQHLRLLDAMRAAVRARAPQVSEAALPAMLARRSGIALDAVKEALRERTPTIDEERFTELSRRLQKLRDSL